MTRKSTERHRWYRKSTISRDTDGTENRFRPCSKGPESCPKCMHILHFPWGGDREAAATPSKSYHVYTSWIALRSPGTWPKSVFCTICVSRNRRISVPSVSLRTFPILGAVASQEFHKLTLMPIDWPATAPEIEDTPKDNRVQKT